ncbi:helix-turn-helix domain-containing protein [Streptomycetaceae bacterium NBC_01309]
MTIHVRVDALAEKARAEGDTTMYAIAQRAGVRESTISRLFAGLTMPSLPTLGAVAVAYDMSLDDLVGLNRPGVPAQRSGAAA